jgi:hypothetical protein
VTVNDSKSKDSRDRSKPDASGGAVPADDQRRFRGKNGDAPTEADGRRGNIAGEEAAGKAPMDAEDEAFLKSK